MKAIRIWKRDRTFNLMSPEAAAENVKRNCLNEAVRKQPVEAILERLYGGEVFETERATIKLTLSCA